MRTFVCSVCGFVYDEALGRPEDGIAAGTRLADVPQNWACPECGLAKIDFVMVEV
jgi:rubredoxin